MKRIFTLIFTVLLSVCATAQTTLNDLSVIGQRDTTSIDNRVQATTFGDKITIKWFDESDVEHTQDITKKFVFTNQNLQVGFKTVLTKELSLLWGFKTGQYAEKLTITPEYKLGLVYTVPTKDSVLKVSATHSFGSRLKERACTAEFWGIGEQQVSCRQPSSALPLDELLVNQRIRSTNEVRISFAKYF